MVKITSLCTGCVQPITNPICPHCFSRHVISWARDKEIPGPILARIRNLLRKIVIESEETPSDVECIVCGSRRVNFCTYCFTNKIREIIFQSVEVPSVLSDFEEDFSTDIWTFGN